MNSFQNRPNPTESAANSLRQLKEKVERETLNEVSSNSVQLVKKISEGTYGTVHVAKVVTAQYGRSLADTPESRLCVVKYMAAAAEETERADFIKEVQLLSGLEDDNISRTVTLHLARLTTTWSSVRSEEFT